jgi:hypothetical protein
VSRPSYLTVGPAPRPAYWLEWIKQPLTPGELETLRQCVVRGAPFGAAGWVKRTAERLHLQSTQSPSPVGSHGRSTQSINVPVPFVRR